VSPCPGSLREIKASHPHPKGWVEVDLKFDGDRATGTVYTPVAGTFRYAGREFPLSVGENKIDLP
jgi:hypothetical protein